MISPAYSSPILRMRNSGFVLLQIATELPAYGHYGHTLFSGFKDPSKKKTPVEKTRKIPNGSERERGREGSFCFWSIG